MYIIIFGCHLETLSQLAIISSDSLLNWLIQRYGLFVSDFVQTLIVITKTTLEAWQRAVPEVWTSSTQIFLDSESFHMTSYPHTSQQYYSHDPKGRKEGIIGYTEDS